MNERVDLDLEMEVMALLLAIHHERPYPIDPYGNEALVHASRHGLARKLHDGDLHSEGMTLLVWKDLALTDRGLALVHAALLGP